MPRVTDIVHALKQYEGRYRHLDAFADDVEPAGTWLAGALPVPGVPGAYSLFVNGTAMSVRLFQDRGVVRFSLGTTGETGGAAAGATVGGAAGSLLGAAMSEAKNAKDGLLGGLFLGMLVGGLIGAATQGSGQVEKVLALRFEPASRRWLLYDGPLLPWAKRRLSPSHVG